MLGYDDLLSRLADALEGRPRRPAHRMRRRWSVVMVDEFQDTDPVQWEVIDAAFDGHATLVLIGDPKQAIYAFRGGDIVTYLQAAATAGAAPHAGTNWRSDPPLVDRLPGGAGRRRSSATRTSWSARSRAPPGHRLSGAPSTRRSGCGWCVATRSASPPARPITMRTVRDHVARDLAADIGRCWPRPTYDGRPVGPATSP